MSDCDNEDQSRDDKGQARVASITPRPRRAPGEGRLFHPAYRNKRTGQKRRTSTWYIRYHDAAGQEITESTGTRDRKTAATLLTERLHAVRQGTAVGPSVDKTTFDHLAEMIRNDYRINGRRSLKRLEESLGHLEASFKGHRVVTILEDRIAAYTARRLAAGASNGTVNRELACLKRMLRLGHRARRVGHLPHITMLAERNRRKGFFEPDQYTAVLDHLPVDLRPLVQVAYITGWRIASELVPLEWHNVDFTNGLLRIEDSKNGEAREFPFTPELRAVLEEQRRRTDALEQASGRIIPRVFWRCKGPGIRKDGTPIGLFRKPWLRACAEAGVPNRIPHDFRRTAVRNLELAGVPRSIAMQMVGHKTESVYRRYAIGDDRARRAAAEALASLHEQQKNAPRKVVLLNHRQRS